MCSLKIPLLANQEAYNLISRAQHRTLQSFFAFSQASGLSVSVNLEPACDFGENPHSVDHTTLSEVPAGLRNSIQHPIPPGHIPAAHTYAYTYRYRKNREWQEHRASHRFNVPMPVPMPTPLLYMYSYRWSRNMNATLNGAWNLGSRKLGTM